MCKFKGVYPIQSKEDTMFKKDKVVQRYIIILNAKSSKFKIGIKCWLDMGEEDCISASSIMDFIGLASVNIDGEPCP